MSKMETTDKKPENPLAFPVPENVSINYNENGQSVGANTGMTLRDYFAAKALQGLLASNPVFNTEFVNHAQSGAKMAYNWADAMLAERSKK